MLLVRGNPNRLQEIWRFICCLQKFCHYLYVANREEDIQMFNCYITFEFCRFGKK